MYILYGSLATYFGINDIITISQNIGYIKNHIINANPPLRGNWTQRGRAGLRRGLSVNGSGEGYLMMILLTLLPWRTM